MIKMKPEVPPPDWWLNMTGKIFTTATTFMNVPSVPLKAEEIMKAKADVAILGAPFEGPTWGIPGTTFGPITIRYASAQVQTYDVEYDIDLLDHMNIVDCGDVVQVPHNTLESYKRIEDGVSEIVSAGAMPITFGGDHAITYPAFKGFHRHKYKKGKIGLIQFDSHSDTYDIMDGSKHTNATEITRISELENVDPKNIVQVGIRAFDREGRRVGEKLGITTFYARETLRRGFEEVTKEAIDIAKDGTDYLYCTVDIDVLDAAYAPGTSWPSPGGPTTMQLMNAVGMVGKSGVDAFDLVEVFPQGDPNMITARAAGWITRELLLNQVVKD